MTLTQALAVVLGSALGAALTAQLLAFKIAWLALGLLLGGALLYLFAKRFRQRSLGQTALGFGLLFYGMTVMTAAVAPLRASPAVAELLARLEARPVLEFGVALVLTAIFQSSSVSLALLMTLASLGLVVPGAVIPFVLGAHLGGAVTPVISSLGAPGRDAKRTAVADLLFKLANGLVFLPFYQPLADLAAWSSAGPSRQVANAYTFFAVVMAAVFLPLAPRVAGLMLRLAPPAGGPRRGEVPGPNPAERTGGNAGTGLSPDGGTRAGRAR